MSPRFQRPGPPGMYMPPLDPWMKQILIGLGGLFVVEVIASALGAPLGALVWRSFGLGFAPWQLVTRLLIQGPNAVFGVALGLLVLYFLLPSLASSLSRNTAREATLGVFLGATLLPLALDALGLVSGAVHGWQVFLTGLITLFGLLHPRATINLYFLIPIQASWIVWGTLGITLLVLIGSFAGGVGSLGAAEHLGAWVGAWAWWRFRGPGARQHSLRAAGRQVERQLRRFQVYEGGRSPRRGRDDVH